MEAIVQLKAEQSGVVDGSHVIFTIYKLPSRPRTDQTLAPIGNILKLDDLQFHKIADVELFAFLH